MLEVKDHFHNIGVASKIDIPVLIIFFARPEILKRTFKRIQEIKPSKLLFWQDGPREGKSNDVEKIMECRKIVENIDWECDVYRFYHEENMGCDPSTHLSHKWAFSIVEKCIILEDDILPSKSFFLFCKEMLDKYEDDLRIDRICGKNLLGIYNIQDSDYFFAKSGNSHGWATWRRVAELWDSEYSYLTDLSALNLIKQHKQKKEFKKWNKRHNARAQTGKSYWELIVDVETMLNSRLIIYPKYNLIQHIGVGENSTHYTSDINLIPKKQRKQLFQETYELDFPLRHPKHFLADINFIPLGQKTYEIPLIKRGYNFLYKRIKRLLRHP